MGTPPWLPKGVKRPQDIPPPQGKMAAQKGEKKKNGPPWGGNKPKRRPSPKMPNRKDFPQITRYQKGKMERLSFLE